MNWDRFVETTRPFYLRKAEYYLRDEELAGDVVQDLYVKIFLKDGDYNEKDLGSMGYRLLDKMCLRILVDKHRSPLNPTVRCHSHRGGTGDIDPAYVPDNIDLFIYLRLDVGMMIDRLRKDLDPEDYRIYKAHMDGYQYKELAAGMGMSASTLRNRMAKVRHYVKKLYPELEIL